MGISRKYNISMKFPRELNFPSMPVQLFLRISWKYSISVRFWSHFHENWRSENAKFLVVVLGSPCMTWNKFKCKLLAIDPDKIGIKKKQTNKPLKVFHYGPQICNSA